VATAAPLDHYSDDGAGVLQEAFRDGFEVYYDLPHYNCTRCSLNDGSCWSHDGYDDHVVSCSYYCPDQHCSPSKTSMSSIPLISYISLLQNPLFSYSLPILPL